jgi:hypothetical protein
MSLTVRKGLILFASLAPGRNFLLLLTEVNVADGFKRAYLLRRDVNEETEFIVVSLFNSMNAVQGFAGESYELAVVSPETIALVELMTTRGAAS